MTDDITLPGSNFNIFQDIDNHLSSSNISYMDCVLDWCEKNGIEIEYVASLLQSNNIATARIRCEAEDLNFLKKEIRIPL